MSPPWRAITPVSWCRTPGPLAATRSRPTRSLAMCVASVEQVGEAAAEARQDVLSVELAVGSDEANVCHRPVRDAAPVHWIDDPDQPHAGFEVVADPVENALRGVELAEHFDRQVGCHLREDHFWSQRREPLGGQEAEIGTPLVAVRQHVEGVRADDLAE